MELLAGPRGGKAILSGGFHEYDKKTLTNLAKYATT